MNIVCLDLEGVLVPEIWINVAERTGISDLKLTTRDLQDYDELMAHRLNVLDKNGLGIKDIQKVIATLSPLAGAKEFLDFLRQRFQVIILSDTFYEFAGPLMRQLDWPTLFCHRLEVSADGRITGYKLRQKDQKRMAVEALQALNFQVMAAGDSYNDISMLKAADTGFLFRPPEQLPDEFPEFRMMTEYPDLLAAFTDEAG